MAQYEESSIKIKVDGEEPARTLADIKKEAAEVRDTLRQMKEAGEENTEEYRRLKEVRKDLNVETEKYLANLDIENASMNELTAKKRILNTELKNLAVGSEEWIAKLKEIAEVNDKIDSAKDAMEAFNDPIPEQNNRWKEFKDTVLGFFSAFTLENIIQETIQWGKESVNAAAELSDAMADVEKSAGMTTQEVQNLVDQINQIDTRTASEDLLEIAKVGGQIGIAKDEMLGFVKATDMATVALADEFKGGAEEVANTMGGLQMLFKETKDLDAGEAITRIGSAINQLGSEGRATGPVVADFVNRMGQLGDLSPQITETMGLGAAFQELGLTAEIAAGGLSNILLTAAKDTESFAKQIGVANSEVTKWINTDPNKFLLELAKSMQGIPADQVAKRLAGLGINSQEATKVLSLLKDQTELVTTRQKQANDAFDKGTSLLEEFNKKNNIAAAELAKTGKEVKQLSVEVGTALLPVVVSLAQGFVGFINVLRSIPAFVAENKASIALLAVAIATLNANMIAATASSLAMAAAEKGRIIWTNAATTAQAALNAIMSANPIGLVIASVAALASGFIYLYNNSITVRAGINGLWEVLKATGTALANFAKAVMTADFKGMASAFTNGGKDIANAFSKGYNDVITAERTKDLASNQKHLDTKKIAAKKHGEDVAKDIKTNNADTNEYLSKEEQKKRDAELKKNQEHNKKVADDRRKANEEAVKDIALKNIELIADEKARELALLQYKTDEERKQITNSVASQKLKLQQYKALDDTYIKQKEAIEKKYRDDKEKDEKKKRDEAEKEEKERTEKEKSLFKELADYKVKGDKALKETLLSQHKTNLDKSFELKKKNLQDEYDAEKATIQKEYEAKVAHINAVMTDERAKQQAIIQLNEAKNNQIQFADTKLQNDLTNLNKQHLDERKKQSEEFFNAINGLMTGDFNSFMNFLNTKFANEKASTDERLQMQTQHATNVLNIGSSLVTGLTTLNKKYTEDQIARIEEEKEAKIAATNEAIEKIDKAEKDYETQKAELQKQLAEARDEAEKAEYQARLDRLEDEHQNRVKDRQTLTGKLDEINKDADNKEKEARLNAFKRDQALQIAQAVIAGALAAIKSLATMGWPLGLIGVAASAVMTAANIATIKSQKPPTYETGGYVRNAGVPDGPRHGSRAGEGGIALVKRAPGGGYGDEIGEMEGGEPIMILSRNTYKNNRPIIDRLLKSSLHRNGAPIFAYGGVANDGGSYRDYLKPLKKGKMYENGTEVASDPAEAAAATASTTEQIQKSQKVMEEIATNTATTTKRLESLAMILLDGNAERRRQSGLLQTIADKNLSVSVKNYITVTTAANLK